MGIVGGLLGALFVSMNVKVRQTANVVKSSNLTKYM